METDILSMLLKEGGFAALFVSLTWKMVTKKRLSKLNKTLTIKRVF
ncbi:hypothetical protein [Peribacillus frigoritolerans]